jgi:hypothetical protein
VLLLSTCDPGFQNLRFVEPLILISSVSPFVVGFSIFNDFLNKTFASRSYRTTCPPNSWCGNALNHLQIVCLSFRHSNSFLYNLLSKQDVVHGSHSPSPYKSSNEPPAKNHGQHIAGSEHSSCTLHVHNDILAFTVT